MNFKDWLESNYLPRTPEEELEIQNVLNTPISVKILDDQYNFMRVEVKYPLKKFIYRIPRKNQKFYQYKAIVKNTIKKPTNLVAWLNKYHRLGEIERLIS